MTTPDMDEATQEAHDDFLHLLDEVAGCFGDGLERRVAADKIDGCSYWDESRCAGCLIGTLAMGVAMQSPDTDEEGRSRVLDEVLDELIVKTSPRPIESYVSIVRPLAYRISLTGDMSLFGLPDLDPLYTSPEMPEELVRVALWITEWRNSHGSNAAAGV